MGGVEWQDTCNYAKRSTCTPGKAAEAEGRFDMAATTLFTCVCGRQKQTSNHWVLARITASGSITFMPWDWNLAMNSDIIVLCGEGCASALLSRSLGEWKRPIQKVAVIEPELAVA